MKLHCKIGLLFFAAILAACNPFPRESERVAEAMRQAEAVYGDGNLLVETDTALFIPGLAEASGYYAGKKQYAKAALAALYNGYTERDFDKEAAMASFMEAEHYGKLAGDSLTMARAEYWMGKMHLGDYLHTEALLLLRNAFDLFQDHYEEKAITINAAACCLIILGEYDSASLYLQHSLHYADLAHSEIARSKALNNYAVLFKVTKDYSKAIDYLRLIKPENQRQKVLNTLNLAEIFDNAGLTDSAVKYYNHLEFLLESSEIEDEIKSTGYKNLSYFKEQQNDLKSALEYRKKYEVLVELIMDHIAQKNVYRFQQKYDYEALENNTQLRIANKQRILIIAFVLLSLMTLAFGLSQQRLAIKTKQEAETRKRVLFYVQRYYQTLSKQGETMRKVAIVMDNKTDISLINELVKTVFGDKDPWDAIVEVYSLLHPEDLKNMKELHPDFTELERRSFILSYFKVSRQDEALLLKINIHTVDKLRQSVKKKTSTENMFSR